MKLSKNELLALAEAIGVWIVRSKIVGYCDDSALEVSRKDMARAARSVVSEYCRCFGRPEPLNIVLLVDSWSAEQLGNVKPVIESMFGDERSR